MRPVLKLRWAVLLVQRMTSDDDFPGSNPNLNLALMAGKCSRLYFLEDGWLPGSRREN